MAAQPEFRKTLTLTGVTVNAMALIAPGAFLWITYQLQAAQVDPSGASTALDMWPGLVLALIIAFLTALSYSMLTELYPNAGTGSSYYFAEKAFLDKEQATLHRWARLVKYSVGWISHLYYWVYPGVLVATIGTLMVYILGLFGVALDPVVEILITLVVSFGIAYIAFRGISSSTNAAIAINVIQIASLVIVSILALAYRFLNPEHVQFVQQNLASIVIPHSLSSVIFQSTIAILLLVGFETATALTAESLDVKHVSRGIILSLIIQGLIFYLFEYFAMNAWIHTGYTGKDATGAVVTGMAAAAASGSPMGDMVANLIKGLFGGSDGAALIGTVVVAVTVVIAVAGSVLSCMNTGVRMTYAIGKDKEVPAILGMLHGRFSTPHYGVLLMGIVSAVIGAFGVLSVRNLTAVIILSNIGTFLLYGFTNIIAFVAFRETPQFHNIKHFVIPLFGFLTNLLMLVAVVYLSILGGGDTGAAALMAIAATVIWVVLGAVYFVFNTRSRGERVFSTKLAR
jgi:amino acid transporter